MVVEWPIRGVGKMLVSLEKGAGWGPWSPTAQGGSGPICPLGGPRQGIGRGWVGHWGVRWAFGDVGRMLPTGVGKIRGVVGCVDKWKMGCVEIGEGKVVGAKLWGGVKMLGRIKEGGGGLRIAHPREAVVSIPAVPASPGPDDKPLVGDMMATGLCGGNLRTRYSGVDEKWGVGVVLTNGELDALRLGRQW